MVAKKQETPPVEIGQAGMVTQLLEKHGIAVFLLLAGGYVVTTSVINPMVDTSRAFVADIKEANDLLRADIAAMEKANLASWDRSFELHTEKRNLIIKLDDEIDALARDVDKLRAEVHNLRTLFIKPFPLTPAEPEELNTPGE